MLGREVCRVLRARGARVVATALDPDPSEGEKHLDICDAGEVDEVVRQLRPSVIINCAAYTRVDDAEREYGKALETNAAGPLHLARVAARSSAALVHISTDYVFGGESPGTAGSLARPYREDDPLRPCGMYGHSKRLGEELVRTALPGGHLIVRTSWLFGPEGPNFVATMLRLGAERPVLAVVNDQIGSPTWAPWLAEVLAKLVEREARGTFHASSRGGISWYEFAREVLARAGLPAAVEPQTTAELARPAPRPAYSVLDVDKLEQCLGERCPEWQAEIQRHLQRIAWR